MHCGGIDKNYDFQWTQSLSTVSSLGYENGMSSFRESRVIGLLEDLKSIGVNTDNIIINTDGDRDEIQLVRPGYRAPPRRFLNRRPQRIPVPRAPDKYKDAINRLKASLAGVIARNRTLIQEKDAIEAKWTGSQLLNAAETGKLNQKIKNQAEGVKNLLAAYSKIQKEIGAKQTEIDQLKAQLRLFTELDKGDTDAKITALKQVFENEKALWIVRENALKETIDQANETGTKRQVVTKRLVEQLREQIKQAEEARDASEVAAAEAKTLYKELLNKERDIQFIEVPRDLTEAEQETFRQDKEEAIRQKEDVENIRRELDERVLQEADRTRKWEEEKEELEARLDAQTIQSRTEISNLQATVEGLRTRGEVPSDLSPEDQQKLIDAIGWEKEVQRIAEELEDVNAQLKKKSPQAKDLSPEDKQKLEAAEGLRQELADSKTAREELVRVNAELKALSEQVKVERVEVEVEVEGKLSKEDLKRIKVAEDLAALVGKEKDALESRLEELEQEQASQLAKLAADRDALFEEKQKREAARARGEGMTVEDLQLEVDDLKEGALANKATRWNQTAAIKAAERAAIDTTKQMDALKRQMHELELLANKVEKVDLLPILVRGTPEEISVALSTFSTPEVENLEKGIVQIKERIANPQAPPAPPPMPPPGSEGAGLTYAQRQARDKKEEAELTPAEKAIIAEKERKAATDSEVAEAVARRRKVIDSGGDAMIKKVQAKKLPDEDQSDDEGWSEDEGLSDDEDVPARETIEERLARLKQERLEEDKLKKSTPSHTLRKTGSHAPIDQQTEDAKPFGEVVQLKKSSIQGTPADKAEPLIERPKLSSVKRPIQGDKPAEQRVNMFGALKPTPKPSPKRSDAPEEKQGNLWGRKSNV